MKKENQKKLKRAIEDLPLFTPPAEAWERINQQLDTNATPLQKAIDELPIEKAPQDSWNKVTPHLPRKQTGWILAKAAATLLLLIAITYFLNHLFQKQDTVTTRYYTENIQEARLPSQKMEDPKALKSFIDKQCAVNTNLCRKPEFINLQQTLKELSNERVRLDKLTRKFPNDPAYKKYLVKIESEMIKVEKEMLQKLLLS